MTAVTVRIVLLLVLASTPEGSRAAASNPLEVDLADPEPAGLDLLPGITDEEAALLAEVAGPGAMNLGERLSGTGISQERLRQWAPYLILPGSTDFAERWMFHSSVSGGEGEALASRTRVAVRTRRTRGSWGLRRTPDRADLTGSMGASLPPWDVSAGSFSCGLAGGDPWGDPIAHRGSRTTTIPASSVLLREKGGSRGVVLARKGAGAIGVWRDRTAGSGLALAAAGPEGFGIMGGGTARAGVGLAVRLTVGGALLRCATHAPKASPPSLVVDMATKEGGRGRIRVAWPVRPRRDGLQGRVDWATAGRIASLRWSATGAVLGPNRSRRSSILGDFRIEQGGRDGTASMALAWNTGVSARLRVGRALHVPRLGVAHLDTVTDIDRPRGCRLRPRMALIHGPLRLEIQPPILGGRKPSGGGRSWIWTMSIEQREEK